MRKCKHPKKLGGQPVLSDEDEKVLAENIATFADWGYHLDSLDVRCIVQDFLKITW